MNDNGRLLPAAFAIACAESLKLITGDSKNELARLTCEQGGVIDGRDYRSCHLRFTVRWGYREHKKEQALVAQRQQAIDHARFLKAQKAEMKAQRELDRVEKWKSGLSQKQREEARQLEVQRLNSDLVLRDKDNKGLLASALGRPVKFDWMSVYERPDGEALGAEPVAPQKSDFAIRRPGTLMRLLPGSEARHKTNLEGAKQAYLSAYESYRVQLMSRQDKQARALSQVHMQHQQIDDLQRRLEALEPAAIAQFFELMFFGLQMACTFPKQVTMRLPAGIASALNRSELADTARRGSNRRKVSLRKG